jgi:hypothetical protein
MLSCRSIRHCLLVVFFLVSIFFAGCQGVNPTVVPTAEVIAPIADTSTPAPTRTLVVLPATHTPVPPVQIVDSTNTPSPTPTATLNIPQTLSVKATNDKATECKKHPDSWEITVSPSWQPDWCQIKSIGGFFYEYTLLYPDTWMVKTFGEVFPNMAFIIGQPGVELRLYQVYKYGTRKYEGSLEDAPLKGSFCDTEDKCTLVVNPKEKINNREILSIGGKKVLIVDSQDGKYNVRRYFFFVPFKNAIPKSNRLFFFKLYTPEPVSSSNYRDLENKIERMIPSIREGI